MTDGALGGFAKQAPSLQTNVHNQWFLFPPPGKHMPLLPMYIIQQWIIKMSSPHLEDTRSPSLSLPLLLSISLANISAHTPGVQTHLMRCSCQVHGAVTTVWVTDTPTPQLEGKSARYPSHSITVTLAAARDPSKLHYADINRRVTYRPLMGQNRARPCYLLNTIKLWPSSSPPSKAQGDNKCWLINNWSVRTVAGSVDQVTVGS